MKKISKYATSLVGGGAGSSGGSGLAGGAKDEDGEDGGDAYEEANALLRDHRELSYLPIPITLPNNVCDPTTFPFYQPVGGWQGEGEAPYIKELQAEAYRATLYIRDDWIRKQMKLKETEFTTKHELKFWVGTYNVNGKKPEFPVDPFVCFGEKKRGEKFCYDLVVVGFQEMVDLNVQNAVSDSATKERTSQWIQLIERALDDSCKRNGEDGYTLLAHKSLVGLMVCAFVLKKHRSHVAGVQTCSVATGVMGVVGNKGCCSIRFDLFDTSFCFVCAHLAAHTDAVDARNSDVRTINAKASFKLDPPIRSFVPERHHSRIAATTPGALARGELLIKEHDYLVWLGDFNYRMDASNTAEEVFEKVNARDLTWLYSQDQLMKEMRAQRVFQSLKEVAKIPFLPTYKFEPGTDSYDRRPDKKVRAPAWTDRILWRVPQTEEAQARCLSYDRVDFLRASDHKPVEASLVAVVRVVNDELRNEAYKEVLRKFNGVSGGNIPDNHQVLKFEPETLDFGEVIYRKNCEPLIVKVTNPSTVPLCWRLVVRPGQNDLCAPWITVEPTFGLLLPGEVAQIRVDCLVGLETARIAASGDGPLELMDVLDIRQHPVLEQTAHTLAFSLIKVRCDLRPTSFGAELSSLLWALKPIRQFGTGDEQYSKIFQSGGGNSDQALLVPKELWRLIDKLKGKLSEHRVFLHHAEDEECSRIRDALDEGTPFPSDVSTHAYASVLLEFLDALADPVVPAEFFPDSESINDPSWPSNFFSQLPTPNANVLTIVIALVQRALVLGNYNKLTLAGVAPLFAEVLFRPTLAAEANKEMSTANASGLGEFANWLTASVPFSGSSSKNDSRGASQLATQAFTVLMNAR